ncbi:hypothetical protein BH11PSE11_BH11PSE11_13020 [soil metagenome]
MKQALDLRNLTSILLAALALALLVIIVIELDWGARVSLPIPQPKPQKSNLVLASLQPEFVLPPLEESFAETLARPLLVPSRRPSPPAPPPEPPKPTMRKGQFALVGVILTKGTNVALLRDVASGKVSRVEQGKTINDMRVEKMEPEKVTLEQYGDREEIVLKIQAQTRQPQPMPMPAQTGVPGNQNAVMPPMPPPISGPQSPPLPGFVPGFGPSPYANHAQPYAPGASASPNPQDISARRRAATKAP